MAEGDAQTEEAHYSRPGWSWGGFMFNAYFAACLKRYWFLAWLLPGVVFPLISLPIWLGLAIYFGVKGREMAAASPTFASKQQYIGFMKGIDHAGKVLFILFFVVLGGIVILGVFASVILAGLGSQRDAAREASAMSTARSLVPVMTLCLDSGGTIATAGAPTEGAAICSDSAIADDMYPELYGDWEYGVVQQTNDEYLFYFTLEDDDVVITCTAQGCEYPMDTTFFVPTPDTGRAI